MNNTYVIGLEFGTDSARALLVNATTGQEVDTEVAYYTRWMKGMYTDASIAQFRHHPVDYIESLQQCVTAITKRHADLVDDIVSISLDSTASTPCLVDKEGTPLSLKEPFKENPDAMFVVWKDHTGQAEADEINALLQKQPTNYSLHTGNFYSAECFWAKVLHTLRSSEELRKAAYSAVEICDYIPALLTGCKDAEKIKMGHCCAASKMMWAEEWGGYPPVEYFQELDPILLPILEHLPKTNYYSDEEVGKLTPEWAEKLGLKPGICISAGNIDSHSGGVGGGIIYGTMVMNLGTSACFMSVMPKEDMGDTVVEGIFGQVDGSILKNMIGFESGLSSFGDDFAWFKNFMSWPLKALIAQNKNIDEATRAKLVEEAEDAILMKAAEEAEKLNITVDSPLATDWFNGRRAPFTNNTLTASITNLNLSTTAPEVYYAIAEATAFAAKSCIDHNSKYGVVTNKLIGIGGIAQKSPFVVQLISDAVNMPIEVSACKQAGTMGSVIHAAVAAKLYDSVAEAQKVLCSPAVRTYTPNAERHALLQRRYERYKALGLFTELEQTKTY